jgi:hypothetical protein
VKIAFILEEDPNLLMVTDADGESDMPLLFLRNGTTSALLSGGTTFSYNTDSDDSDYENYNNDSYTNNSYSHNNSYDTATSGEKNALQKAHDYLDYAAFSYEGLIDQLEFEGYSTSEATYAADNCGADWNEQAVKAAKQYLSFTAFSESGLVDQLIFEG